MANVKITALTGYGAASNADVFVVVDVANDITKKITLANLRTSVGASNQSDLLNISSGLSGANTAILNLQGGLSGSNTVIIDTSNQSNNNTYMTWLAASANDGTTLSLAYSNDGSTLSSARANDYSSYITLSSGLVGTNAIVATKDTVANVYSTYLTAMSNDSSTLARAYSNDYSTYLTIKTGLEGTNSTVSSITASPVTFQSDVLIRGNLTLTGNTTIVNANTISFGDSLLSLAANNIISDNIDIGLYGHYWNGSANSHTGIFRSSASKDWMIFSNYTIDLEGNSTVNISNSSFTLGNLRVRSANASQDMYTGNSVISSSIFSNGVELRSNDYATYLMVVGGLSGSNTSILNLQSGISGTNTIISTKDSVANVYATYLVSLGGLTGANTAITNLQSGLSGTNSALSTKDSVANVYATYLTAMSNDNITYTRLYANVNSVQSNLDSYAAYANTTFISSSNLTYIVNSYTTTVNNSYYIGTTVSSINNVSVYLNGVYQNKNQYILSNSSSNIQFTDPSLASSLSLEITTIR